MRVVFFACIRWPSSLRGTAIGLNFGTGTDTRATLPLQPFVWQAEPEFGFWMLTTFLKVRELDQWQCAIEGERIILLFYCQGLECSTNIFALT